MIPSTHSREHPQNGLGAARWETCVVESCKLNIPKGRQTDATGKKVNFLVLDDSMQSHGPSMSQANLVTLCAQDKTCCVNTSLFAAFQDSLKELKPEPESAEKGALGSYSGANSCEKMACQGCLHEMYSMMSMEASHNLVWEG